MFKVTSMIAVLFAISFGAMAQTKYLPNCGGTVALAQDHSSYSGYSLIVNGVRNCSNLSIAGESSIKFNQNSYNKFNVSRQTAAALRYQGVAVSVRSNSGRTSDVAFFKVASAPTNNGPRFLQSMRLGECGGKVELYKQASGRLSVKFIGVDKCSNFIINQTQESYKLTDGQGDYQTRNFTLSNEASRYYRLDLTLRSNSGKTRFDFTLTNP